MKNPKLKIAVIGTVGLPAKYGGFETLVHHLVENLGERFDMTVYASGKEYPAAERVSHWKGAKIKYLPFKANGVQSIIYDLVSIVHALFYADVLLVLGVSGCIFLPILKMLFPGKKIMVNIDGLEWRRPKWNWLVKKFLLLSEAVACKYADEVITDNRILEAYVKIRYNADGRLIEYGADHVKVVAIQEKDYEKYPFLEREYTFKVARIEPENNLHIILEAYANLSHETLVIVGNWQNSSYGKTLVERYGNLTNITLLDPIYEPQELNLLRSNASLYVHGHSAGGTNPSLVEAMYLGLPVLSFDVIYNRVTTNNQAIYFSTVKELEALVLKKRELPIISVAQNLKTYADKQYTWPVISNRYGDLLAGVEAVILPEIAPDKPISTTTNIPMKVQRSRFPQGSIKPLRKKEHHAKNHLIAGQLL